MEGLTEGPRLRELHWVEQNTCRAVFDDDGKPVETVFRVEHRDGITFANDDARVLERIAGTAAQVRSVVAAVVSFCAVAEGRSTE